MDRLYTIAEVAELVGMHRDTVRRLIRAGELRAIRPTGPTGHHRIKPEDLEAWLEAAHSNA